MRNRSTRQEREAGTRGMRGSVGQRDECGWWMEGVVAEARRMCGTPSPAASKKMMTDCA
jgi:hypothetical protein